MRITVLIENTTSSPELVAEHGLSLLVEACGQRLLFDTGASETFAENARRLGVDLGAVDAAVLSHGHYDHGGGIARFLELNPHAPVWVSPHAFDSHFNASGKDIGLPPELARHPRVRCTPADGCELAPGVELYAAVPGMHPVPDSGMTALVGNQRVPDDFRHEQYLLVEENGCRYLFSGCSHGGILNIVSRFQPDVLVGGFHLMKADPVADAPMLEWVARGLEAQNTRYYTGHCTGAGAAGFLKQRLRERLVLFSTGMVMNA